ncbi:MAG TPA: DUF6288 domain-containing protein, partial [Planctomycetota bacterium]|nr:DUF6288 domain-containing protein [Planctomycetota bacterium]
MKTFLAIVLSLASSLIGQVHYHADGGPWRQRASSGPDAEVPGWYYNLGVTGLRVELVADHPTHLVVRHVLSESVAENLIRPGDHLVGALGRPFEKPHKNGYGMEVFGAAGPIEDFAVALEEAMGKPHSGKLRLSILREGKAVDVTIKLPRGSAPFAPTFPSDCAETDRVVKKLLEYLAEQQRKDGSFGSPPHDLFAPLAFLASGDRKYGPALKRAAEFHAKTTHANDQSSLINWRYMAAGIFLSEYFLSTREKWVLPELAEIYEFLLYSQYTDLKQLNPRVKESHPGSVPKGPLEGHGGFGHNVGFEGYGPIGMITAQGALTFALMKRCGINVDRRRHDAAYAFLQRGTGKNGYVWYEDEVAGDDKWADMGRTGAAGVANLLSPYEEPIYLERAALHASLIGAHPESFPDTHGSPTMGMVTTALGANADPQAFQSLMKFNRYWFVLSRCADGTFYYQPNRDNAGYGGDSRLSASAATA